MPIQTALSAFQTHAGAMRTMIADLQNRLAIAEQRAAEHPENWGYAGSMAHAVEKLREASESVPAG